MLLQQPRCGECCDKKGLPHDQHSVSHWWHQSLSQKLSTIYQFDTCHNQNPESTELASVNCEI